MLIQDLARRVNKDDEKKLRKLWKRRYYKPEQEQIIDIYEGYIGKVVNRSCGKCRSSAIDKIQKLLNFLK